MVRFQPATFVYQRVFPVGIFVNATSITPRALYCCMPGLRGRLFAEGVGRPLEVEGPTTLTETNRLHLQGGPLPVINGVVTPVNGLING